MKGASRDQEGGREETGKRRGWNYWTEEGTGKSGEVPLEDGGVCLGSCRLGDCFGGGRWGTVVNRSEICT